MNNLTINYADYQLNIIRNTYAKALNNDEFALYVETAKNLGLNILKRQIYAQVYMGKDDKGNFTKRNLTFITGIDGLRAIASRNGEYRASEEEPTYEYSEELKSDTNPLGIDRCVCYIHQKESDNDHWHKIAGVAYWDEFAVTYYDKKKKVYNLGSMWKKMPRLMIAKCAEAQALRKGWTSTNGLYIEEEMGGAGLDVVQRLEEHDTQKRLARINSKDSILIVWDSGSPLSSEPIVSLLGKLMDKINSFDNIDDLRDFARTNSMGLKQYWAKSQNDALAVKGALEKAKDRLNEPVTDCDRLDKKVEPIVVIQDPREETGCA